MCNCTKIIQICPSCKKPTDIEFLYMAHSRDIPCTDVKITRLPVTREQLSQFICRNEECWLGEIAMFQAERRYKEIKAQAKAFRESNKATVVGPIHQGRFLYPNIDPIQQGPRLTGIQQHIKPQRPTPRPPMTGLADRLMLSLLRVSHHLSRCHPHRPMPYGRAQWCQRY